MTRVLVTGATGFIGRHLVPALTARGFEVHVLGRRVAPGAVHHAADLLDPAAVRRAVAAAGATHLVHLAWDVTPGAYWRSPGNLDWVAASLGLVRAFVEAGGARVVGCGTCAEYAWGGPVLIEGETPCAPATFYGVCKDALSRMLAGYGEMAGVSVAWGRIFYLYGPGETPGRLVSDAVRTLMAGARFETSHGRQRRDFMHVADAAGAFAALADCDVRGAVNIGLGAAPAVRTVLETVAAKVSPGGLGLIDFGARALSASEPEVLEASVGRLMGEVGFRPRFDLDSGIADTVAWWRAQG